jgi:hypothetical protein
MSPHLRLASVGHWPAVVVLVALVLSAQLAAAQATGSGVTEQALVDNDTVRVAFLVFPPGAASVEHVGSTRSSASCSRAT